MTAEERRARLLELGAQSEATRANNGLYTAQISAEEGVEMLMATIELGHRIDLLPVLEADGAIRCFNEDWTHEAIMQIGVDGKIRLYQSPGGITLLDYAEPRAIELGLVKPEERTAESE